MTPLCKQGKKSAVFNGNLNDINQNSVVFANTPALNKPGENGYCITLILDASFKKQIYYEQNKKNGSFERECYDGVWGNWISKAQKITTGTEFETGRIIDGRKEYGKIINIGKLPNASTKEIAFSVEGLRNIRFSGQARAGTYIINFVPQKINDSSIVLSMNNNKLFVTTYTSNYINYEGEIEVYYTKN